MSIQNYGIDGNGLATLLEKLKHNQMHFGDVDSFLQGPDSFMGAAGEGVYVTIFNSLSLKLLECELEPACFSF